MTATDAPLPVSAPATPTAEADHEEADHELVVEHLFDAFRTLVFNVWTDPRHLALRHACPNGVDYNKPGRIHRRRHQSLARFGAYLATYASAS